MINQKGIYKHFKGDYYVLFGMAKHTETNEDLALYTKLHGNGTIFVRPIEMFFGKIMINGITEPRFKRIA